MTENEIHAHCEILRSALINVAAESPEKQPEAIIIATACVLLEGFMTDINRLAWFTQALAERQS